MGDFYELFYDDAERAAAPPRHHADRARRIRRRADPDGRRAVPRRRGLSREADEAGRVGGDLRADRRPGDEQGTRRAQGAARGHAGHGHRCQPARRQARQPARRRQCGQASNGHRVAQSRVGAIHADRSACRRGRGTAGASRRRGTARSRRHRCRSRNRRSSRPVRCPLWQFDAAAATRALAKHFGTQRSRGVRRRGSRPRSRRRGRAASVMPPRRSNRRSRTYARSTSKRRANSSRSTPRRDAISRSPKRCAASRRRRSCRCSTPASRRRGAGSFDIGSRIRCARRRAPRRGMPRSSPGATIRAARRAITAELARTVDVERIAARIALASARPRDLAGLRDTLARLPAIARRCSPATMRRSRASSRPVSPSIRNGRRC